MKKQKSNLFEEHIEKIVLVIAGLLSIGIFVKMVVLSPDAINYEGRKFSPGEIDSYISSKAEPVRALLDASPKSKGAYSTKSEEFLKLMDCSLKQVDTRMSLPQPVAVQMSVDKRYRVPKLGGVSEVAAEHLRAAAYVPVERITEENYNSAESYEVNDIDLVTVEGKLDVAALVASFEECFAGEAVNKEWRDPCLAEPVFAAVELERQRCGEDGQWGQWEVVPPLRVEPMGPLSEVVEDVKELPPGGITVRMLRFKEPAVQMRLLQAEAYQIASADEEWLPPVLHQDYMQRHREMEAQEKREARAEAAAERDEQKQRERDERSNTSTRPERRPTSTTSPSSPSSDGGEAALLRMMYGGGGGQSKSTTRQTTRPERRTEVQRDRTDRTAKTTGRPAKAITDKDIYEEYEKIQLKGDRDWRKVGDSLVLWAHDDTAAPGQTYRYRIRVGVFNPIAGTSQFEQEYVSYADKVVLWSDYSDVTSEMAIPGRAYFFPTDVQEPAKAVAIQVARYALGYWYSEQFSVKRGDTIGKVAAVKAESDKSGSAAAGSNDAPKEINYDTGAVVVDVVPVNDWAGAGSLYARHYYDMLFSYDGTAIGRMPAKLTYWTEELRSRYNEIRLLEKKEREPFKAWGASGRGGRRTLTAPRIPGMPAAAPGQENMTPEEIYLQMMMGGQGGAGQRR